MNKPHNRTSNLIWIDLEMTGLNPATDVILEIATIVTDIQLNTIAQGPSLIIHQPDAALDAMTDYVKKMHTKSGLINAVKASTVSLAQAEEQTLNFIKQHCRQGESPLCGNTVWFDRLFLSAGMPRVLNYVHYRLIDVSSIKEVILRWYPNTQAFKKDGNHRALEDIQTSIEELKYYRKLYFVS